MKMKVKWYSGARSRWLAIGDYILQNFGARSHEKFILSTVEWIGVLKQMPQIGALEPLLSERSKSYRSIVINKQSKLIYYINGDTICIADFWDTRREPKLLVKGIK